jgi:hypothetical protein
MMELARQLTEGRARKLAGLGPDEQRFFQAVLRAFPALGGPPSPDHLAVLAAAHRVDLDATLRELAARDLLQRDGRTGEITCANPFSGRSTPHVVEVDGTRPVFAMCALDALGIPFMLDRRARIRSRDPVTGQSVVVKVQPAAGRAVWEPPSAVITVGRFDGDGPLLHTCCGVTHLLTSTEAATRYLGAQAGLRGEVLGQQEAVEAARGMFGGLLSAM